MPKNRPAVYDTDERSKQFRTDLRELTVNECRMMRDAMCRMHREFEKIRAIKKPTMRQSALEALKKDMLLDADASLEDDEEVSFVSSYGRSRYS